MSRFGTSNYVRAEQRRFRRANAGQAWSVPDLPKFYYLSHFKAFLADVHRSHFDCLRAQDLAFMSDFKALPKLAQCVYVRMANRRGYVFDKDKFNYAEISDLEDQIDALEKKTFQGR